MSGMQGNEVDIESLEVKLANEDHLPPHPPKLSDSKSEDPRSYISSSRNDSTPPPLVRRASEPVTKPLHSWHLDVPLPRAMGTSKSLRISLKRPTFYCSICMENVDVADGYTLTGGVNCTHMYCKACLQTYVTERILEGQVDHPCPMIGYGNCEGLATEVDIEYLVTAEVFEKYNRFFKMKTNDDWRDCPQCSKMILGDKNNPQMTCSDCKTVFCYFHSNAHPNQTCWQYARNIRATEIASKRLLSSITKKCPQCKSGTEKNGGCNHMTCAKCAMNWCWLCGNEMGDHHFEVYNLFGCAGAQFLEIDGWDGQGIIFYKFCILVILIVCMALFLIFIWVGIALDAISLPILCIMKHSDDDSLSLDDAAWATMIPGLLCAVPVFGALMLVFGVSWFFAAGCIIIAISPILLCLRYVFSDQRFSGSCIGFMLCLPFCAVKSFLK